MLFIPCLNKSFKYAINLNRSKIKFLMAERLTLNTPKSRRFWKFENSEVEEKKWKVEGGEKVRKAIRHLIREKSRTNSRWKTRQRLEKLSEKRSPLDRTWFRLISRLLHFFAKEETQKLKDKN